MKKTFRIIGMLLVAVMLSVGMAACGDDDGDVTPPEIPAGATIDQQLVGTWTYHYDYGTLKEDVTLTFNANGTYRGTAKGIDDDGPFDEWAEGQWYVKDGFIYANVTNHIDKTEVDPRFERDAYRVDGNQLYLDGDVYTKK